MERDALLPATSTVGDQTIFVTPKLEIARLAVTKVSRGLTVIKVGNVVPLPFSSL